MNQPSNKIPFQALSNHFLIAMPGLIDSNFSHAVIYICEHTQEGAMGLVVNYPIEIPLSQVFEQFEIGYPPGIGAQWLLSGGPVQTDRGFILHRPAGQKWKSTQTISHDISLTSSKDIIPDIARERGPHELIIALGYSGWGPGQLEEELANNAWLTVPADADIVFNVPFDQRAGAAAAKIGIDLNQLSVNAGHA